MLFGTLLHRKQKHSYAKLFIGVESGYKTSTPIIRVRNNQKHVIQDLELGDKIIFNGHTVRKANETQFAFHFIIKHAFKQCATCLSPLHSMYCHVDHDVTVTKLDGKWIIVYKKITDEYIKTYFENKKHAVFALVSTASDWHFDVIKA